MDCIIYIRFKKAAENINMIISTEKTKSMAISKNPIHCKLMAGKESLQQVMKFSYLGSQISSARNLMVEVNGAKSIKASKIPSCLRGDVVWRNKYMSTQSKVRIYKTCVRLILTYAAETRAETSKTKSLMRSTEMKTLRTIKGVTLRDQIRSSAIKEELQTEDVIRSARSRR